jgi:hypothetical protein
LAKYAKPVPCYVCEADNRFDSAVCQQCHAPLAIGYSNDKKQTPPQLMAVVGAAGVGKTCYLGLLMDMLSRSPTEMQLLARGAFSVSLQQQTMSALACRQFPPPTPLDPAEWMWVHCAVRSQRGKRPLELVLPDISGERALREVESPDATPAIRRMLTHGAAALVLVDAEALVNGTKESEFFALKVISNLVTGDRAKKGKGWASRPVAVVFTKADRCDWAFDSPDEFARRYTPGLWRQCQEQLHCHRFYATSVAVVATAFDHHGERMNIPLRIEPRRVIEPFAWAVEQISAASR